MRNFKNKGFEYWPQKSQKSVGICSFFWLY